MSMAVGASLTQTYWEHMAKFNRAELVGAIDPSHLGSMVDGALQALGSEAGATAAKV